MKKKVVTVMVLITLLGLIYSQTAYPKKEKPTKKEFCSLIVKLASRIMVYRQMGIPRADLIKHSDFSSLSDFEQEMRVIFTIEAYKQPLVNEEELQNVVNAFALETHNKCMTLD